MASVTSVWLNPLDFVFSSLAQLSFVRSAVVSMSVSHSSNFDESWSLKTVISCSSEFVRFGCFWETHNVSVYWHITSPKGSVDVGMEVGCFWSVRERFCSSHSMWFKPSGGWSSLASTYWHKLCISLISAGNLASLLGVCLLGWPSASDPPKAMVVSELLVLSLLLSGPVLGLLYLLCGDQCLWLLGILCLCGV